jgi:hypothetical protein
MDNHQIESDIAMLLMLMENEEGDLGTLYRQIHDHFEKLSAGGDDIPSEFVELKKELDQRFAA